jgi:hypothetical protein
LPNLVRNYLNATCISKISARFRRFLQILRNGFIQAFNARFERPKPDAG